MKRNIMVDSGAVENPSETADCLKITAPEVFIFQQPPEVDERSPTMLKHFTRLLAILTLLCTGSLLQAADQAKITPATPETALAEAGKPIRDPVAQLRGKLLYKRSQTRKLERTALGSDAALGEKIRRLEAEIEALYCAAEPKLESLYAEQKQLQEQIDSMSKKE